MWPSLWRTCISLCLKSLKIYQFPATGLNPYESFSDQRHWWTLERRTSGTNTTLGLCALSNRSNLGVWHFKITDFPKFKSWNNLFHFGFQDHTLFGVSIYGMFWVLLTSGIGDPRSFRTFKISNFASISNFGLSALPILGAFLILEFGVKGLIGFSSFQASGVRKSGRRALLSAPF